jgi:DNA processing protein
VIRRVRKGDAAYPPLLGEIYDPPRTLHVRGEADLSLLTHPAVAIVGARACSPYGAQVARLLGRELGGAGFVVVSGMARGIDGEAHRGALEAGGITVAVLGCGVDRDYPAAHAQLARRICERGLIASEYEPGVEPAPFRFPARNRIISGLAAATIVVEAREKSGALITADFALDQNRLVFAVPGEITSSLSAGTNRLIREGAAPLTGVQDVLDELGVSPAALPAAPAEPNPLLARLAERPWTADELSVSTGLGAAQLAAALAELELAGAAVESNGVYRASATGVGAGDPTRSPGRRSCPDRP